MKSESKKFTPIVEKKELKKWFISYERWNYVGNFFLTEKKGEKIQAETIEQTIS